eukprot:515702_1
MKGPTKKLLNSCTTEDRKQTTSGYSFRELSNATLSSISECEDIENFLIKRLKKDNPIVKLKCLRIIKYICEHGRDTFKINMQSKIGCLRSCTSYTGPLDPLYGDRDFKHVQATAKDVIKAVFVQSTNRRMPVKMESQQGGGFDGGSRSGGGFGGGPGGYSASGVYSRGYSPDRTSNSDSSIFSKIKSAVTEKATALANRSQSNDFRPKNYESRSSYRGPGGAAGSPAGGFGRSGFGSDDVRPRSEPTRPPPKSPSVRVDPFTRASTTRQPHLHRGRQKGKVGGVWGDAGDSGAQWGGADDSHERAYDRDSGSYDADSRGEPDSGRPVQAAEEEGLYEQRLVDEICTPAGVRAAPPRAQLTEFAGKFARLNHTLVLDLLADKLEEEGEAHTMKLRTLFVVEALMKSSSEQSVKEYFVDCPEILKELTNSRNKQLRTKSTQLATSLGLLSRRAREHTPPSNRFTATQNGGDDMGDLLGLGVVGSPVSSSRVATSNSPEQLFSDLQISDQVGGQQPFIDDDPIALFMNGLESEQKIPDPESKPVFDPLDMAATEFGSAQSAQPKMNGGFSFIGQPEPIGSRHTSGLLDPVTDQHTPGLLDPATGRDSPGLLDILGGGGGQEDSLMDVFGSANPAEEVQTSNFAFVNSERSTPKKSGFSTPSPNPQFNQPMLFPNSPGPAASFPTSSFPQSHIPSGSVQYNNSFPSGSARYNHSPQGGSVPSAQQNFAFSVRSSNDSSPQPNSSTSAVGGYNDPFQSVGKPQPRARRSTQKKQPDSFSFVNDLLMFSVISRMLITLCHGCLALYRESLALS